MLSEHWIQIEEKQLCKSYLETIEYMLQFDNNFYIKNIEFNGKCSILNVSFIFILFEEKYHIYVDAFQEHQVCL